VSNQEADHGAGNYGSQSTPPDEPNELTSPTLNRAGIFDHGFESYRTVTDADYRSLFTSGLVVLDTNVLLNLYRYHEQTRRELLNVLANLGDHLWIPHHVMGEFWQRRPTLLQDPRGVEDVVRDLEQYKSTYNERVRNWATRVGLPPKHTSELLDTSNLAFRRVTEAIRKLGSDEALSDAGDTERDPIVAKLNIIFDGRVGNPLTPDALRLKIEEARQRFKDNRPPGYRDAGKKQNFAGDYLIWAETLGEAATRSVNVLLVTGDVKDDWWRIENGQAKGPRPELVAEMADIAGVKLFMLRPESLLYHASKILPVTVSAESVQDMKSVSNRVPPSWSTGDAVAFLLRGSVAALARQAAENSLLPHLMEQFRFQFGYIAPDSKVGNWERSIPALLRQLIGAGLGDVEVLLEYRLPLSSKRADVVLVGQHPNGGPSCMVVENKQWSRVELVDVEHRLVQVTGSGRRERLHPQEQVRGYVEYMQDFNHYLGEHPGSLAGCIYLDNATSANIAGLRHPEVPDLSSYPAFAADEVAAMRSFLTTRFAPVSGVQVADDLLASVLAPSKRLMKLASQEIHANPQFVLLDEQELAYQVVLRAVEHAMRSDAKEAIVITGGPGSGKSVIALSLLAELARRGYNVSHATGSRSFTTTLRKVVGRRAPQAKTLFRYTNTFAEARDNGLDVLIVDEAHRIRLTSNNRYTRAEKRSGTPQADELVRAARVPVFLIDEHQAVRPEEVGTVTSIEEAAARNGATVRRVDLDGQFRYGGSEIYARWVEQLLGLIPGGPRPWPGDDAFQLLLAGAPEQMEAELRRRIDEGYVSRITAGFCWPWSDPSPDGTLVDDIVIGSWSRPWHLRGDRALNDIPPGSLWATDDAGFGQVGSVYTAQGFEYDYGGTIMGSDLVWRGDQWQSDAAANRDPGLRKADNFDHLIRNAYKVLLTRGRLGCVIYSVDQETQQMLAGLRIPEL
jgi:uncharacterized protein